MKTFNQFMEQATPPPPPPVQKNTPRALLKKPVRPTHNTPIVNPPSNIKYNTPTIIDTIPTPMDRQIKNFRSGGATA